MYVLLFAVAQKICGFAGAERYQENGWSGGSGQRRRRRRRRR